MGKCISQGVEAVWKTKDVCEFMRARYILKDTITSFRFDTEEESYQISYKTDQKPWNMPILSVYVKAYQKYNLFKQYNKLMKTRLYLFVLQ